MPLNIRKRMERSVEAISKQRIHERHVIRNKKRAARLRNVFASFHANAIDRVRRRPEHEPQQRIRQQVDGINRCDQT